jgi:predicted metal-dependent hydrolase
MRAKPELIREFVLKHALWIIKTWRRIEARSASIPPAPRYTTGEMHAYLGQTYPLEVHSGRKASVAFLSGCIHVTAKGEPTAETVRRLLFRWYRTEAEPFSTNAWPHATERCRRTFPCLPSGSAR